jgi:hypothetical protein
MDKSTLAQYKQKLRNRIVRIGSCAGLYVVLDGYVIHDLGLTVNENIPDFI